MPNKTIKELVIALLSGSLFGAGMLISNMVSPQKIIAFLDITGDWDPSLALVMIGAIGIFSPIYHLIIKKRKKSINGAILLLIPSQKINAYLIMGAIIFGIGWGIGGFCPGPGVTSIANISPVILIFILSLLVGSFLAKNLKK
ncbi:YeeE/YedE family protein [Psychromonas sp. PRT-SC03]|nr:YeeE/YedE family protein [Psychromonas sp. PRT-SC03]